MTDALIRRAEHADLAEIVQLRHEWAREEDGEIGDLDFEENLVRVSGCSDAPTTEAGTDRQRADAGVGFRSWHDGPGSPIYSLGLNLTCAAGSPAGQPGQR